MVFHNDTPNPTTMVNYYEAYNKVKRTIESCQTSEQFAASHEMIQNFFSQFKDHKSFMYIDYINLFSLNLNNSLSLHPDATRAKVMKMLSEQDEQNY